MIEAFMQDPVKYPPSIANLRLDISFEAIENGWETAWNAKCVRLLVREIVQEAKQEPEKYRSKKSDDKFARIVKEKFRRLWRKYVDTCNCIREIAKSLGDGQDMQARIKAYLETKYEEASKYHRTNARRHLVSVLHLELIVTI
jgi:hypothetical protein